MPISMSPGTVLDGRYRLDVLLSEHHGARFWRATDTVLARSVAVHVVGSDDPRASDVLAAARRSAGISEPHFLRVLDCDDVDGLTWVINEWGDGTSLDVMLAGGALPPMRAAWLTREVAEAIAAAHAHGLVHGRLNPESVLVTEAGAVKIIGFVVNAAFDPPRSPHAAYGSISGRDADVVDLAGILYAALTGRWPGVAPSAVPRAPREGNRPLRPRQVRAGVPRTLDTICDRVLHKEAAQHVMPVETAHEIAAALSDFVGDPAAAAPVDLPSMYDDPGSTVPVIDETTVGLLPAVAPPLPPTAEVVEEAVAEPVKEAVAEPEPVAHPAARAVAPLAPVPPPAADPDETMAAPAPFSPSGIEFLEPEEWEPSAPPPPFEQQVHRPLFAQEARRVPAGAPVPPEPGQDAGTSWPFEDEPRYDQDEPPRVRSRARTLILLLMVLALIAALFVAYRSTRSEDEPRRPAESIAPNASSAPPRPVVTGTPVRIAAAGDFDPEGDPQEENPDQVELALDGKKATAWKTSVYRQSALGGLKSGVGLILDLGRDEKLSSVEVALIGSPTMLELWATAPGVTDPPNELADTIRVVGVRAETTSAVFRPEVATRSRFLVIWLTDLPEVPRGFQGQIAEITVRS